MFFIIMRAGKIYLSLIISLFTFVSVQAQNDGKVMRDSILNRITDIDAKLKELSIKDTTIGFSAPLKIDTLYANQLHDANLGQLRDENGLLIVDTKWVPFDANMSFRDTIIFEPIFLPVIFDGIVASD